MLRTECLGATENSIASKSIVDPPRIKSVDCLCIDCVYINCESPLCRLLIPHVDHQLPLCWSLIHHTHTQVQQCQLPLHWLSIASMTIVNPPINIVDHLCIDCLYIDHQSPLWQLSICPPGSSVDHLCIDCLYVDHWWPLIIVDPQDQQCQSPLYWLPLWQSSIPPGSTVLITCVSITSTLIASASTVDQPPPYRFSSFYLDIRVTET